MSKVTKIFGQERSVATRDIPGVNEPPPLIYCMGCKHWQPTSNPAFGHCLLGAKSMAGPVVTTDLTSCTRAESRLL